MGDGTLTLDSGEVVALAGPGERAAARVVDLFLLVWPMLYGGAASVLARVMTCLFGECTTRGLSDHYFFWSASIGWLAVVLYEPVAMAFGGRTVGKLLAGIRVVDVNTGRPPGFKGTVVRYACTSWLGSALFLTEAMNLWADRGGEAPINWAPDYMYLGGLMWWLAVHLSMLWNTDTRGWHDRLAQTAVINTTLTR